MRAVEVHRAHKIDDPQYDYRMIFLHTGTGIGLALPATVYEAWKRPRKLHLMIDVEVD